MVNCKAKISTLLKTAYYFLNILTFCSGIVAELGGIWGRRVVNLDLEYKLNVEQHQLRPL